MLQKLDADLWIADKPFGGFIGRIGTRMTVIRLAGGVLFIHSPVALDSGLRQELDRLGPVKAVIAPNRAHHLFVADYQDAYPSAGFFAAPGLLEKRKDLRFDAVLADGPPAEWAGQIDQHLFRGAPFLSEVVFFHRVSRTLLLTDVAFSEAINHEPGTRLFYWLAAVPSFGPHRLIKLMIRDKRAALESVERIMSWDFDRVIVTHGRVVPRGGRDRFAAAFRYLGG